MIHFSKFDLNTYQHTPYFAAHLPAGFPIAAVVFHARRYANLPPRVKKLAQLAKVWARKHGFYNPAIDHFYDAEGRELDPRTGTPLTDADIAKGWEGIPWHPTTQDIPENVPFADPETWKDEEYDSEPEMREIPSLAQVIRDIASRGKTATAQEYGLPAGKWLDKLTDAQAAEAILGRLRQ